MNTYHALVNTPSDQDDKRRVEECRLDCGSKDMSQREIHL